jgi:hypothetical protein
MCRTVAVSHCVQDREIPVEGKLPHAIFSTIEFEILSEIK